MNLTVPESHESDLAQRYQRVRACSAARCAPLAPEDHVAQSMPDASPAKWHLAHTTWFFEELVLARRPGYQPFDPAFGYLFNSYYDSLGERVDRAARGLLTRPRLDVVHAYREEIDARVLAELTAGSLGAEALAIVALGLQHEQQHQELVLTDVKHLFGTQPLRPAYRPELARPPSAAPPASRWLEFGGGLVAIGAAPHGFAFDNERPRHQVHLAPFRLASRPVTSGELLDFIEDGGYRDPRLWLSDGWQMVRAQHLAAPLYWERSDRGYVTYDLAGVRAVDPHEAACHLSYYEADAVARWAGARLPTEAEWELAAADLAPERGHFADDDRLHPRAATADADGGNGDADGAPLQLFGDVWEWTASAYAPYPGFRPLGGALAEYNGKFMCSQQVLRGGSCFTPRGHVRASYRNFFPPAARWQMSGVRLASDA